MTLIAIDPGFPGAGRVLKELSIISKNVQYNPPRWDTDGTIILPAWHPDYQKLIQVSKGKAIICWTSPPLQSEMVPVELEYLRTILHLLDTGKIQALWLGSEHWLPLLRKDNRKIFYAPYPVSLPNRFKDESTYSIRNIGLFGPLHPRKNVVNQLIAVKHVNSKVHITDESAIPLMSHIGVDYVSHGWLPQDKYEDLLLTMDLCLQVSIHGAESFSYVCWDAISRGIPCLTSVQWAPSILQVSKTFDPLNIAVHINMMATAYPPSHYRDWAQTYAERTNSKLKQIFDEELSIKL